jgi:hypothetical protein
MLISLRILGKELRRKKLKWFDLRRADFELGKKAYKTQSSMSNQNQTSDRITQIQNQIEALNRPISSGPSFKQKVTAVVKGAVRVMKIQILKFKRNRLFRKLGGQLRQSSDIEGSLTLEAEQSRSVSEKIDVVNSEIRTLAAETYLWARKPLMAGSLVLILMAAFAAVAYEQGAGLPSDLSGGAKEDAAVWSANYRNAKFITRAEFLKRVGPMHLLIRDGPTVEDDIHDIESIVTESAAQHGITITPKDTDVRLVIDVDINRNTVTHSEEGNFGKVVTGEDTIMTMPVQMSLAVKANCRRGDGFVRLSVFPLHNWQIQLGKMGLGTTYAEQFRKAVDTLFQEFAVVADADDTNDMASWNNSLWPAAQDAAMHGKYLSALSAEPGRGNPILEGVRTFDIRDVDLIGLAQEQFDAGSIKRNWISELTNTAYKVDPSAEVRVLNQIAIQWKAYNRIGEGLRNLDENAGFYVNMNIIRVTQRNVVFKFNGELRRTTGVWIWNDVQTKVALPEEEKGIATKLNNQSISFFVKSARDLH